MDANTIQALEDLARAANYRQQQAQARADQIAGEVSQVEIFLAAKRQELANAQQAIAPAPAQPQAQQTYPQPVQSPVYPYPVASPYAQPQPAPQAPQRAPQMPEPRNLGEQAVQIFLARQAERAVRGEGNPLTDPSLPMGLGPVANWRRPGVGDVVIPPVYF